MLLAVLIAGLAMAEGANRIMVFAVLLLVGAVALLRAPLPAAAMPPIPAEPEPIDLGHLLRPMTAGLAPLDMPVLVLDHEASVFYQNPAAERALDSFPLGAHLSAKLRSPGILDMVRETIATGIPNQIEHSERLPSERVYIVRIAPIALPRTDLQGQSFFLLSFRDISELRHIDRMRSDFVANASHELRTPLASLLGYVETLQDDAGDDAETRQRFLKIMHDEARRMQRLIDDLISLSRIEAEKYRAPADTIALGDLVDEVCVELSGAARAADLVTEIEEVPPVRGDRAQLSQLVHNVIGNAMKYGKHGTPVTIALRREGDAMVRLTVTDQGEGIPPEHIPRLTERFYRVDSGRSRSLGGTGLGLAIVKHVVERHRGRIDIASTVGKGTTVSVLLPTQRLS